MATEPTPTGAEHPLPAEDLARLRLAVARLHRQLVQASTRLDLTFAQLSALARIEEYAPVRLVDLAAREGVAPPSMNRTLGPLHADGLIAKEPDPRDRRSAWITLTEHGRATIAQIRAQRSRLLADRVARLSAEQTATLLAAVPVLELLAEEAPDGG
ncbi:MarR family winged helix-turn-helix transcriptional regulator [Kitasatospora sp. A2-31]|uniref:MarR family winged helix-turn-helix transcriptional regulator n=1 Tax=Kitasatospora sp. A2-31 TaxID=2916414 RepID=UPI001EEE468B|nr:MarR family transcriptional regulator [Kitasatospora sp. A2-31]MCG6499530.1 MarR family transcriptional regulator [Kitasatospora sp. A2-31]